MLQEPITNPAAEEIVIIVDDNNNEITALPRHRMRSENLPHRASYILVFNHRGELFLQKRTTTKDIYPGHYDVAAGGVVLAGESYELSAARELQEELGIEGAELRFLFDHFHSDGTNKVWGRIFHCQHDGPMRLQEEEVESGFFLPPRQVLAMTEQAPFTPDGIEILRRFLKEGNGDAAPA